MVTTHLKSGWAIMVIPAIIDSAERLWSRRPAREAQDFSDIRHRFNLIYSDNFLRLRQLLLRQAAPWHSFAAIYVLDCNSHCFQSNALVKFTCCRIWKSNRRLYVDGGRTDYEISAEPTWSPICSARYLRRFLLSSGHFDAAALDSDNACHRRHLGARH